MRAYVSISILTVYLIDGQEVEISRQSRDLRLVEDFDRDLIFELPPNPHHPKEYAFWAGETYPVVSVDDCDFLHDKDPVLAIRAHGVDRAYPWFLASKPHAINTEVNDVPIAVFF